MKDFFSKCDQIRIHFLCSVIKEFENGSALKT